MVKSPHSVFCLPAIAVTSGCGLFNAADSAITGGLGGATAPHVAVISLLQTPTVPGTDGGSAVSTATIFFGDRGSVTSTDLQPVNGAAVSVSDGDGLSATASQTGSAGTYAASSLAGVLRYDTNALYTFTITDPAGAVYTAIGSAPPPEVVPQFASTFLDDGGQPLAVAAQIGVGSSYTVSRSGPASGKPDIAFVAVFPLSGGAPAAQPTWSNLPQSLSDDLALVANDEMWRALTVTIPGSAFPAEGLYLITLTAIRRGSAQSSDLFSGSAVLLGSATSALVDAR